MKRGEKFMKIATRQDNFKRYVDAATVPKGALSADD
jgi:hypothetical protein